MIYADRSFANDRQGFLFGVVVMSVGSKQPLVAEVQVMMLHVSIAYRMSDAPATVSFQRLPASLRPRCRPQTDGARRQRERPPLHSAEGGAVATGCSALHYVMDWFTI